MHGSNSRGSVAFSATTSHPSETKSFSKLLKFFERRTRGEDSGNRSHFWKLMLKFGGEI
jgi:hypothetical protein